MNLLKKQLKENYVEFDFAMGKGSGYYKQVRKYSGKNKKRFEFFKEIYEKNNFLKVEPQTTTKIPKIIHQIWIGNRQIPKELQKYQLTWRKENPDWEYKLWTNEEVKNYSFLNKDLEKLFNSPLTIGERVDVLRYDLLYKYGGIYADCDCICLKPFDVFVYCYDFFVGVFPPMFHTMKPAVFLQNCLIGAKAKHPIIKKVASLMVDNWEQITYREDEFYTTIERTFLSLTLAVEKEIGRDNNIDIVMPPSYFFPITTYPIYDFLIRGFKETIIGLIKPDSAPFSSFKKNSFSHHYSTKEWLKDIYSTITLRDSTWTLFDLKDWKLFLQSKLFNKNKQKKIARQTFEELINR